MKGVNIDNPKEYVVDASFVLNYLFPDEKDRTVDLMFSKLEKNEIVFLSSYLLPFEIINGLRSAIVQKRQGAKEAEVLVDSFLESGILLKGINEKEVLRLAIKEGITTYDASYLWLAKSKKIKLLTLDENFQKLTK